MPANSDIFLSYNKRDQPAVRELAEALRARGWTIWLDESNLIPGQSWIEALEIVIKTARCAAVLVGKGGLSLWQKREVGACLVESDRRGLSVIPVLLPGADESDVPLFLKELHRVDLRDGLTEEGLGWIEGGITGEKPALPKQESLTLRPLGRAEALAENHQPFTEPLTGIRFLWIPGGRFQMGGDAYRAENPIHWVRVSPFWLGETPVTHQQYGVFLQRTGYREPAYWLDERFSAPDQPVGSVTWEDAQAFCGWLSEASGRQISLPSEAQWEFAARGTDGREYPWGNQTPDETRACFGLDAGTGQPVAVGSLPGGGGPFGSLDLAGNVWEWCRDAWNQDTYEKRARADREPLDPVNELQEKEGYRVLRGGGWFHSSQNLRSAHRFNCSAKKWLVDFGFRVAAAPW